MKLGESYQYADDDEANAQLRRLFKLCESPIEEAFLQSLIQVGTYGLCRSKKGTHFLAVFGDPYLPPRHWVLVVPQQAIRFNDRDIRVDFYCQVVVAKAPFEQLGRIVVELDGHDFHERTKEQARRDRERDRAATAAGDYVLRFTGQEVHEDVDRCVREVLSLALRIEQGAEVAR